MIIYCPCSLCLVAKTSREIINPDSVGVTHIAGLLDVLSWCFLDHWWVCSRIRGLGLLGGCDMFLVDLTLKSTRIKEEVDTFKYKNLKR